MVKEPVLQGLALRVRRLLGGLGLLQVGGHVGSSAGGTGISELRLLARPRVVGDHRAHHGLHR